MTKHNKAERAAAVAAWIVVYEQFLTDSSKAAEAAAVATREVCGEFGCTKPQLSAWRRAAEL